MWLVINAALVVSESIRQSTTLRLLYQLLPALPARRSPSVSSSSFRRLSGVGASCRGGDNAGGDDVAACQLTRPDRPLLLIVVKVLLVAASVSFAVVVSDNL